MNANKFLLQFGLIFFFISNTQGQIHIKDKPYSFKHSLQKRSVQQRVTPRIDSLKIANEDKADAKKGIPPRFGFTFPVNYNLENSGTWTVLPDSSRLWELTIECKKALSINLLYDKFWLPDSAKFFIYNESKTQIIGAFSSINNSGTKASPNAFATGLVYGDKINLEYYEPKEKHGEGVISISGIVHGYRYIRIPGQKYDKDLGESGSCNINVNCTEGANWQTDKKAVALIVVNGNRYCTGCLVNNTNQDDAPFLLTANHCLGGWGNPTPLDAINNPNANTWTFMWNYESPDCSNPNAAAAFTTARATVVANNANSDFALLRLTESPNSLNVYYSGWDRTGSTPASTVCIHHPSGDIKKISIDNNSPEIRGYSDTDCSTPSGTTHWRIVSWDRGTTEGGSSGSPLFNPNHRIIGQLHGGCAACGNSLSDFYGRFSTSWNSSTDSRRRLQDWLDPANTSTTTLDGRTPCVEKVVANREITTSENITGCDVKVNDVTIKNNANVVIDAQRNVTIEKNFSVEIGSTLEIK